MTPSSRSPAVRGRHLSAAELREVVERYADDVRAGSHVAEFQTDQRWHVRIHQDDDVDVWLISWTTEQGTELHDHGGSFGPDYVHDVRNNLEPPALSVHAYSPPIRVMRYYDVAATSLLHTGSTWTDD